MRPSQRMLDVSPSVVTALKGWIASTPGTIPLAQGAVCYGPPPQAIAAMEKFHANPENHKYQFVLGLPALVEALTKKVKSENGLPMAGQKLMVTAGGNLAFVIAVLSIAD